MLSAFDLTPDRRNTINIHHTFSALLTQNRANGDSQKKESLEISIDNEKQRQTKLIIYDSNLRRTNL